MTARRGLFLVSVLLLTGCTATSTFRPTTALPATATSEPCPTATATVGTPATRTPGAPVTSTALSRVTPVLAGTPVPGAREVITAENAGRMQELARWGKGLLTGLIWSPDGRLLAIGSTIGVYLYEANTLEDIRYLDTGYDVSSMGFSPDGALLATGGSSSPKVLLWDVETGQVEGVWEGGTGWPKSMAFSPQGGLLAIGEKRQVHLVEMPTWREIQVLTAVGDEEDIRSLSFSPDGSLLAVLGHRMHVWNLQTMEQVQLPRDLPVGMGAAAFSPDGTLLAVGWCRLPDMGFCAQGAVSIRRVSDWRELRGLEGLEGGAENLAFSPDGAVLAAAGLETAKVKLYLVETGEELQVLGGHSSYIAGLGFSPRTGLLASGSQDGSVRLWDVPTGKAVKSLPGNRYLVHDYVVTGGTAILASSRLYSETIMFDLTTGQEESTRPGPGRMGDLALSPDGALLAATTNGQVHVWDMRTWEELLEANTEPWQRSLAFSPNGTMLAVGLQHNVLLLEVKTGQTWTLKVDSWWRKRRPSPDLPQARSS